VKGLLLALGGTIVLVPAITLLFRLFDVHRRAAALVRLFLASLPVFVLVYALTPADLGLLPQSLVEPRPGLELAYGLFVYSALFFGGLLQVYNLADRGCSLRILIDIAESPHGTLPERELPSAYGGGRGFGAMLDKRIDGLLEQGLVRLVGGRLEPTPRAARAIRVYEPLQAYLRLNAG
jgi:hypothetical protein